MLAVALFLQLPPARVVVHPSAHVLQSLWFQGLGWISILLPLYEIQLKLTTLQSRMFFILVEQ